MMTEAVNKFQELLVKILEPMGNTGILFLVGWFCLFVFAVSMSKDMPEEEKTHGGDTE